MAFYRLDELDDPAAIQIEADGGPAILVRTGGTVALYRNRCPHDHRPLNRWPGKFLRADESALLCGWHGAEFDLVTGECRAGPCYGARLERLPVSVKDGWVVPGDKSET